MIKKEEVEKVSELARLKLTDEEVLKMQKDLSSILDYVNLLKKVKGKPEIFAIGLTEENLRADKTESQSPETVEKLIKETPDKKERYIKVKAILD